MEKKIRFIVNYNVGEGGLLAIDLDVVGCS